MRTIKDEKRVKAIKKELALNSRPTNNLMEVRPRETDSKVFSLLST